MNLVINNIGLDYYSFIFKSIVDKYFKYCDEWDKLCDKKINLNKKQICDIYNLKNGEIVPEFKDYIDSFSEIAEDLKFELLCDLGENVEFTEDFKFTSRIKTRESLIQKILKKMREDDGKFSIKKCINDLLGLRIIDIDYKDNKEHIDSILEELKSNGINIRNIERNLSTGYKAYHIYIIRNNNTFPIEVQIWDKEHEEKNIELHSKHKEEYVKDIIEDYNKY